MPAQAALVKWDLSAVQAGANNTTALQSTFTVACLAPSFAGVGM
jgi:hypothetical protein